MTSVSFQIDYGHQLESEIAQLLALLDELAFDVGRYPKRWLAIKLLEADAEVVAQIECQPNGPRLVAAARASAAKVETLLGDEADLALADQRYGYINGIVQQTLRRPALNRQTLTDRIDDVVTHKWLGLPVFFAVMYLVFRLVIDVAAPFLDWTDAVINGPLARWIAALLQLVAAPDWLRSLVIEGLVAGVGGVLVFIPGLLILYFFLALLEDSGYMSRAAFVMDRFMRIVGLHGKSFIPMLLGFGCAVPAIYATRTIASPRDRLLTALLVPLMSCSARLPVYVVFGMAFFGAQAGTIIWLLYAVGIVAALLAGLAFTRTVLKPDTSAAFVLELPPYRLPAPKSVFIHMWENTREFVRKAGGAILVASVGMWVLLHLPWGVSAQRDSYFGQASALLAPVFAPLGFGDWESSGALVTGFMAKELVISSLSQTVRAAPALTLPPTTLGEDLLGIGTGFIEATARAGQVLLSLIPGVNVAPATALPEDTTLSRALQARFTPLSAAAFLVFVLLYVPCVATLGAIKHEFGAGWAAVSAVYQTGLAWGAAALVYQVGRLLGWA